MFQHKSPRFIENIMMDWIPTENLYKMSLLSSNKNAIQLLEDNPHLICWRLLSKNEHAVHLFYGNEHLLDWAMVSNNIGALHFLEKHIAIFLCIEFIQKKYYNKG